MAKKAAASKNETYITGEAKSVKGAQADMARAAAPAVPRFQITVQFLGGLNVAQKNAFKAAADRWAKVIVGQLPAVTVNGVVIQNVVIQAQGSPIDGVGGILGQAGPTYLRPASAGQFAFIPCKGNMVFDTADLANMQANGTLGDVITHEMGHVLGIGTIWSRKNKLANSGTTNPTFIGRAAMIEYGKLKGTNVATAVPVENTGGPGTANSHWRESIFRNELMSGFIAAANNPLSRVTVASLQDLGYVVDITKAEPYGLANLMDLAERGMLMSAAAHGAHEHPHALPILPIVLGDESLH